MSDIDTGVADSLKVLDPDGRLEKRTCASLPGYVRPHFDKSHDGLSHSPSHLGPQLDDLDDVDRKQHGMKQKHGIKVFASTVSAAKYPTKSIHDIGLPVAPMWSDKSGFGRGLAPDADPVRPNDSDGFCWRRLP